MKTAIGGTADLNLIEQKSERHEEIDRIKHSMGNAMFCLTENGGPKEGRKDEIQHQGTSKTSK